MRLQVVSNDTSSINVIAGGDSDAIMAITSGNNRRAVLVSRHGLTAATIPMENPYCSCKLSGRVGQGPYSCNHPYGESLLQL